MNKETLRMQMLAGVITESQYKEKLQENFFKNLIDKVRKKEEPIEPEKAKSELDGLTDEQALALYNEYNKQAGSIDPYDPHIGGYAQVYQTLANKLQKMYPNAIKESLNEHYVAGGIVGIGAINQIPSRAKADYEDAFEYFLSKKYSINEAEEMSVDAAADKVENAVDDKLEATVDALTDEQKEQLRAELAKAGITANTDPEAIAGKLDESLFEAEGDAKAKIANALSNIGGGLMKSLLVPIIPVAIGSMGPGVAAGLAITAGTAGILIALAKALGAEKSMEEGKEVEEPYNY
jgi:hypothetical protein